MDNNIYINTPYDEFPFPLEMAHNLYKFPIIKNNQDKIINGENQKIAILTGGLWLYNYEKKDSGFKNFINDIKKNVKDLNEDLKIKIVVSGELPQSYIKDVSENTLKNEEGEGLLDLGMIISCCPALEEIHILPYLISDTNMNGDIHMISNLPQQLKYCLDNNIHVISCSYGSEIKNYGNFEKDDYNFFKDYYDKLTICVASGDDGGCNADTSSYNFKTKNLICEKNVSYPGSSKYVLSTGGTQYTSDNKYEEVWYDSPGIKPYGGSGGGGISAFSKPKWQNINYVNNNSINNINKRLVPDVSGMANDKWYLPLSGSKTPKYEVRLVGGTSAVAPMYASFFIVVNQLRQKNNLKPVGFVNDILYELQSNNGNLFTDITKGKNTAGYTASVNYDMATGLGTPNFDIILEKLVNYNETNKNENENENKTNKNETNKNETNKNENENENKTNKNETNKNKNENENKTNKNETNKNENENKTNKNKNENKTNKNETNKNENKKSRKKNNNLILPIIIIAIILLITLIIMYI